MYAKVINSSYSSSDGILPAEEIRKLSNLVEIRKKKELELAKIHEEKIQTAQLEIETHRKAIKSLLSLI